MQSLSVILSPWIDDEDLNRGNALYYKRADVSVWMRTLVQCQRWRFLSRLWNGVSLEASQPITIHYYLERWGSAQRVEDKAQVWLLKSGHRRPGNFSRLSPLLSSSGTGQSWSCTWEAEPATSSWLCPSLLLSSRIENSRSSE